MSCRLGLVGSLALVIFASGCAAEAEGDEPAASTESAMSQCQKTGGSTVYRVAARCGVARVWACSDPKLVEKRGPYGNYSYLDEDDKKCGAETALKAGRILTLVNNCPTNGFYKIEADDVSGWMKGECLEGVNVQSLVR
jgi:hypothetical protein